MENTATVTNAKIRCADCKGTGDRGACGPEHGYSSCRDHYCCDCEQADDAGDCESCRGKGRF